MEVHELLSHPGVLIGVVGEVASPCSAPACPAVMILVCDMNVGIQALHECARNVLGWAKWGGGRFLDIGLCLSLDVLSESLVSSELLGRFEGDGHSSASDSDVDCGPSEDDRSIVVRERFEVEAGIGVPSHIRSRIMATSRCLTHRLCLGLSSSSSRS